nr:hypothetical protein [Tanacetum cinerariifolium]
MESATKLKMLLKEKPRIEYQIEASMNMNDSAVLEESLPLKEKDPVSFTLPCHINTICFEKALADLGASNNKRPKGIVENVLVGIDNFVFPVDFVVLDMPEDIKVPLILKRPFLSTAHAKINMFKGKITLRVRDDQIMFKINNHISNIIRRVYPSLDHVYGDNIELNDLNEPLELRRNQVEDLGPTIEDGEIIDEPMEDIVETRNDENEIRCKLPKVSDRDVSCEKVETTRIKVGIKARRFDGMITIYNGNDSVTYQMGRSHPRFKHLTNAQCNKMRPLLKTVDMACPNSMDTAY